MLRTCKMSVFTCLFVLSALLSSACRPTADQQRCRSSLALKNKLSLSNPTWETGAVSMPTAATSSPTPAAETVDPNQAGCTQVMASEAAAKTGSVTADDAMSSSIPASTDSLGSESAPMPPGGTGQGQPIAAGLLTAGAFDDALNLEVFKKYWANLSKDGMAWDTGSQAQIQWPKIDNLILPKRFAASKPTSLDLSLIIDVTGSMGDELEYIKKELKSISSTIQQRYPGVKQRFSLIVYKDQGDEFVTRGHQFTEDLASVQSFLDQQSAGGGGDYPEALDVALSEANSNLQWGDAQTAKLSFLIADAPAHDDKLSQTFANIQLLKDKGVHVYPVAASGVGDSAERIMRYAALVTAGEYLFLTDDSRIGNPHAEPHIPCYHVRKLNELMIATISAELEQQRRDPLPSEIIRTVGTPLLGVCQ